MTAIPTDRPPLDGLRAGLDGYIDYVQEYEHAYRAMHRGRESGDRRVRAAIERNTQRQIDRVSEVLSPDQPLPPVMELAIRGALALTIATCLDWLYRRQVSREHLREMLVHAYLGALLGALHGDANPVTEGQVAELFNR